MLKVELYHDGNFLGKIVVEVIPHRQDLLCFEDHWYEIVHTGWVSDNREISIYEGACIFMPRLYLMVPREDFNEISGILGPKTSNVNSAYPSPETEG